MLAFSQQTATGEAVALAGPSPYLIDAFVGSSSAFTVDDSGNDFYGGNLLVAGTLTARGSFQLALSVVVS